MLPPSTTTWISERANELGFAMAGVVRAYEFPDLARNEEWLARGYAGEMNYLRDPRRTNLEQVMPGVRSVIVCALIYNTEHVRTAQAWQESADSKSNAGGPRGWISRYAWGDDYHQVLRAKLELLLASLREQCGDPFEGRVYSDTGPINERVLAKHAGLGWLGKNTLLLNERLGSFFFLGAILTTLDLEPTPGSAGTLAADRCGSCRKCIDACPTAALVEPYVMDARKCISYLTIELRGPVPKELRKPMGQHIFGCDICQDVCPWNRSAPITDMKEFQPRHFAQSVSETDAITSPLADPWKEINVVSSAPLDAAKSLFQPSLEWLGSLDDEQFSRMFRGSPIKRTKWQGLMRNVCIALGNSHPHRDSQSYEQVLKVLKRLAVVAEPVIAESAQLAISCIQQEERD